jgi:hypothetical protein
MAFMEGSGERGATPLAGRGPPTRRVLTTLNLAALQASWVWNSTFHAPPATPRASADAPPALLAPSSTENPHS